MTQLLSHVEQIYKSFNENDEVDVILDFAKAFDKVDHTVLLELLKNSKDTVSKEKLWRGLESFC